jgi:hypothetical protein
VSGRRRCATTKCCGRPWPATGRVQSSLDALMVDRPVAASPPPAVQRGRLMELVVRPTGPCGCLYDGTSICRRSDPGHHPRASHMGRPSRIASRSVARGWTRLGPFAGTRGGRWLPKSTGCGNGCWLRRHPRGRGATDASCVHRLRVTEPLLFPSTVPFARKDALTQAKLNREVAYACGIVDLPSPRWDSSSDPHPHRT